MKHLMKNKNLALLVAGIIFIIVAAIHATRLVNQTIIFFGAYIVPMWVSKVGFIVAVILASWMFVARSAKK